MEYDNLSIFLKCMLSNIYSIIIFLRIKNCMQIGRVKGIFLIGSTVFLSLIYLFFYNIYGTIISMIIICSFQAVILKIIVKFKITNILISIIIARSLVSVFLVISATIEYVIQLLFNINNMPMNMIITCIFEGILVYFVINIKRLKNGLSFLKIENECIEIVIINVATVLVLIQGLMSNQYDKIYKHLYFYYIILGFLLILTIQKTLIMYYKQKLVDDTISQYKQELQEKEIEIKRLTDEAFKISKINHEFYNRQKSLELMVENALKNTNMEAGEEINLMDRIKEITEEHSNKMKLIKSLPGLPVTEICELDDMFKYMQTECNKDNIQFKLNINGNIYPLVNNIITKSKLVTLIGDHIRDAIIAVNKSESSNKEVFVVLGLKDDFYELCILDTGIEFEIDTLLKLGLMPITTHKESGGSGIGFITTFETLKECKGSLIIEEKHKQNETDYTKAVKIRFDGKSEYRICSYRLDEIFKDKNKYKLSDRELIYRKIDE